MNYNIHLVTESYVKSASTLFNSIEWKMISPSMNESQKYALNVIGTGLMNELQTQVSTSAISESNEYLLSNFIRPLILNYLIYESAEFIHYKLTPTGIQIMQPNESIPASERGIDRVKNAHKKRAEGIANDLRLYLIQNANNFPLYNNPGVGVDIIYPQSNNYFCGIYLNDGNDSYSNNLDTNL